MRKAVARKVLSFARWAALEQAAPERCVCLYRHIIITK